MHQISIIVNYLRIQSILRCGLGGHWSKECPKHSVETLNIDPEYYKYNNFRQMRGVRHASGIGPIRNSLSSHGDFYARTFRGSTCNTFGGMPFSTRSAQVLNLLYIWRLNLVYWLQFVVSYILPPTIILP